MTNFICPECGSKDPGEELFLEKVPNNSKDPWDSVLQQVQCLSCKCIIPVHLAERWNNISIEEAKKEWLGKYKKNNQKQKF